MTHQDQHDVAPHDQAIEDVLHALRTTTPPQGYESRIHNALLQASLIQSSASHSSSHSERSEAKSKDLLASLRPWMQWATACAVVLILGIAVGHHLPPVATQRSSTQSSARIHERSTEQTPVHATETTLRARTKPTPQPRSERANLPNEITHPQRIEVALETHEYIPEPPMPLTQQERLVLRMARRNDAQQLAEYTPDARARQLREDAKAYHDYFAEKPLDGQPIYHQKILGGTQ